MAVSGPRHFLRNKIMFFTQNLLQIIIKKKKDIQSAYEFAL